MSTMRLIPGEPLTPGKRYRVTLEGIASPSGRLELDNPGPGARFVPDAAIARAKTVELLEDPAPKWRPGDVVVVRFSLGGERLHLRSRDARVAG